MDDRLKEALHETYTGEAKAALRLKVLGRCRQCHQASQAQAGKFPDLCDQFGQFSRLDAALALLLVHFDLQADIEWRQVVRALFVESSGLAEIFDTVNPGEIFCNGAGFIALNPADKMPLHIHAAQLLDLFQRLLQITLTESLLSGAMGLPQLIGGPGFADRQ